MSERESLSTRYYYVLQAFGTNHFCQQMRLHCLNSHFVYAESVTIQFAIVCFDEHGITDRVTSNYGVHKGLRWFVFRFVSIYRASYNACLIIDRPFLLAFAQPSAKNTTIKGTYRIADFDEIWHEYSFQNNIWPVCFFYRQWSTFKGWKLKLEKHILSNWWKLVFFHRRIWRYIPFLKNTVFFISFVK